jgi:hypothetical protein
LARKSSAWLADEAIDIGRTLRQHFRMRVPHVACLMILSACLFATFRPTRAADCISGRVDYDKWGHEIAVLSLAADAKQICGSLAIRVRARDDSRLSVNVFATYPEFENPQGPAERRYNEWLGNVIATMDFDRPITLSENEKIEDVLVLTSLYRSRRLISAAYYRWLCCGAHGISAGGSINLDAASGIIVSPQDLFSLPAVANQCWRQFAALRGPIDGQGELFKQDYPMDRPFSDKDFESDPVRGPLQPSVEKTVRLFHATLKRSSNWTFTEQGAAVGFGALLGYAGAAFDCSLNNATLRPMAQPGVSVPP